MSPANPLTYSEASDESTGRRVRKALLREIDTDQKKKAKEALTALRAQLRAARAAHREALKGAVAKCRAHRATVSEKLKAERAQALAELRAKGESERASARGVCAVEKGAAGKGTSGAVAYAREELAKERGFQEDMKRIERGNRARIRRAKQSTVAERRSESDDEVRNNIPLCGAPHKGMYAERAIMRARYREPSRAAHFGALGAPTEALGLGIIDRHDRSTCRSSAGMEDGSCCRKSFGELTFRRSTARRSGASSSTSTRRGSWHAGTRGTQSNTSFATVKRSWNGVARNASHGPRSMTMQ